MAGILLSKAFTLQYENLSLDPKSPYKAGHNGRYLRVSIAGKRHHDHGNSYKGKRTVHHGGA